MALNPAEKANEKRRIREILAKDAEIQENLLGILQKQSKEYENVHKKLKEISSIKEAMVGLQKELENGLRNVDSLENNIVKRNLKIKEASDAILSLQKRATSDSVKRGKLSNDELEKVLKLRDIWKDFKIGQGLKGRGVYTTEQIKIIKDVAAIEGISYASLRGRIKGREVENQKVRELIQLAINQQKLQKNESKIFAEERVLREQQIKNSKDELKNWVLINGSISNIRNLLSGTSTVLTAMGGSVGRISAVLANPEILVILAGMHMILKSIWELFVELDKAAFVARKEMGMMRGEHRILRQQAEDLYKEYAHLGVTVESVYKTQKSISLELGSSAYATKEIVTQAALMSSQFGISEGTTVKMLKTLGQLGGTTAKSQTQMVGFAGALSNAAGVPLPEVMDDVAKASETTRTMFAKVPLDMIKAAVEARRMGTTLDKMASSSRKLLNFSESIEAEMEASVLLGRPINLQLARQLAYSGKIAESNKEILRISKQVDFENMDPFSAEAFAKATGKSVDELRSMVQASREDADIKRRMLDLSKSENVELKRQYENYQSIKDENESAAKKRGEDYNTLVATRENQERMVAISNQWKKITMELGQAFLPIIDGALKLTAILIPLVGIAIRLVVPFEMIKTAFLFLKNLTGLKTPKFLLDLGKALRGIMRVGPGASNFLNFIAKISQSLQGVYKGASLGFKFLNSIGKFFSPIFKVAGVLTKLVLPFAKWIPVIGWIITGVQFLYHLVNRFMKIDTSKGFWNTIWQGIKAVVGAVYDVLIQPFVDVWNWLKTTFLGNSPSTLGLMIVDGLKAVGSMLFDSITAPFKKAWDWISNLFSSKTLQPSIAKPSMDLKSSTISVPTDKLVQGSEIESYRELNTPISGNNKTVGSDKTNGTPTDTPIQSLLNEIKGLRDDLNSGKIAVNMDGQLVSTVMNRGIRFRGEYGAIS